MAEPFSVVRIPEIEPIPVAGVQWKPLRRPLGIDAFGINAYTALAAGDHVVEEHTEERLGHQEAYVVLNGRATFTLDSEAVDAPAGTVVFVRDPAVRRHAIAAEAGTTVLAIGGVPGVHTPSAWEWYFEAERYRASGEHEAALELLAEAKERHPDNAGVLYSTACWQALGGDTAAAITSLKAAIALEPKCADWAQNDSDLDSIRGLESLLADQESRSRDPDRANPDVGTTVPGEPPSKAEDEPSLGSDARARPSPKPPSAVSPPEGRVAGNRRFPL